MKSKRTKNKETNTKKSKSESNLFSRFTFHDSLFTVLLIAAAALIVYSNTFHVPFQFDDLTNISDNPVIKNIGNFISSSKGYDYNPRRVIGYLSFALNYHFGGLDVTGYHIVNLSIHIVSSILVYFLVTLTFRTPFMSKEHRAKSIEQKTDNPMPHALCPMRLTAFFSGLLFAVHPLQTQAVTYIVQRFASLATMFYLLSVVMYIKARLKTGASAFAFACLSVFSAVLAMKTKETTFTLPVIVILYEFIFFKSSVRKKLFFFVPILLTMLIIPLSVLHTHRPLGEIISDLSESLRVQSTLSRWDYLMTQMRVITTYIRLIFLPVKQNLDYDYPVYHSLFQLPVFLSFVFLAALFGLGVYLVLRAKGKEQRVENAMPYSLCSMRLMGFGILWFFIALSVESSVIPIVDVIFEHRLYLPLAGASIAVTTSAFIVADKLEARWKGMAKAVVIAFALIAVALSITAYARNRVWHDGVSLWRDVVSKSPGNARAYNNLGYEYMNKKLFDNAINEIQTAIRLKPDYEDAYFNLGVTYKSLMMLDKAKEEFLIALKLTPDDADARYNLGIVYQNSDMPDKALEQFLIAIKLRPDLADVYSNIARIYRMKGMFADAIRNLQLAIKLRPDKAAAHFNLGLVYYEMGQMENARRELTAGLMIEPDNLPAQKLLKTVIR